MNEFKDIFGSSEESSEKKPFKPWAICEVTLAGRVARRFVLVTSLSTDDGVLSIFGAWYEDYEAAEGNPQPQSYIYGPGMWVCLSGRVWNEETDGFKKDEE